MKKIVPFTKEINFKTMISKISSISLEHTLKINDDNTINGYFIVDGKYKMTQASQIDEEFSYKIPVDIEIDSKYDISKIEFDIDDFTYELVGDDKVLLNISLCIDKLEEKEEVIDLVSLEKELSETIDVIDNNITEDDVNRSDDTLDNLFLETTEEQELIIPKEFDEETEVVETTINNNTLLNKDANNTSLNTEQNINNNFNITNLTNDESGMNSLFSSFKDSAETFKTYSVYIVKEEDTINSILIKYNIDRESLEEYNDLSNITCGSKIIIPCGKNE